MLKKLGWLSVNQLACEQRLMQVWKSLFKEDYCLQGMFKATENQRETRSTGTNKLPSSRKDRPRRPRPNEVCLAGHHGLFQYLANKQTQSRQGLVSD